MSTFYGSVGARGARSEAVTAATGVARELEARTGRPAQARRTLRGFVELAVGVERSDIWGDDRGFAVVQGSARVKGDAVFAEAVRQHGLARACALQYAQTGTGFLDALDGFFALAIYREEDDRLLLAIDRVGVFSLYYAATGSEFVFSNRLSALRLGVGASIDPQAIYDYLYLHQVSSPGTIFKEIRRLSPGTFVERQAGAQRLDSYWSMRSTREADKIDFAAERAEFLDLLSGAVRRELEAESALGCFLSGGTDSSTLAGMLTRIGKRPARTYSIGFEQQGFDEMEYARIAVRHFGTQQREYYLQPRDIVSFAPRIPEMYGQPFGNSSVVPTYYCAALARSDGVDTLIAGDGGDELFGGNTRYATQQLFSFYSNLPGALRRHVLEPLAFRTPVVNDVFPVRKLRRYIEQALEPMPDRLQTYNYLNTFGHDVVFEPDFLQAIDTSVPKRAFADSYNQAHAHDSLNKMMALDLKFTLADTDLPKVMEATNAAGVAVTFPFLQQEIVDFAARLPASQRVNRLRLRYFFKKALGDFLPIEIIRKKKHGFGMPFGDWLLIDKPLRALAMDSLSALRTRGIVRPAFIDDLRDSRLQSHPNYYGGFIWILMILELWLEWNEARASDLSVIRTTGGPR